MSQRGVRSYGDPAPRCAPPVPNLAAIEVVFPHQDVR